MNPYVIRKLAVAQRISGLPPQERERAERLYKILDRMEWLTIAPYFLGLLSIPLLLVVVLVFGIKTPAKTVNESFFWGVGIAVLAYSASIIVLKLGFFNPARERLVSELGTMFAFEPELRKTLETIKRLDPDMVRYIGKLLPDYARKP